MKNGNYLGVGIALGAGVGTALGVAIGNIAIGAGVGVAFGIIFSSFAQRKSVSKKAQKSKEKADE